jgi:hypothetical protein
MFKKLLIASLVLLGTLVVAVGGAFWFREDLVRFGAGRLLADQVTVTRLEGLQISSRHLAVDELEVLLHASGQRIVVGDLGVDFRVTSFSTAPAVESLVIGSVQVLDETPAVEAGVEERADADPGSLLLSDLLALLREFPFTHIAIANLVVPQRGEALALELQRGAGQLDLRIDSGALRLDTHFAQADADATALLQVTLSRNAVPAGNVELSLQPAGETYQLTGKGQLDVADLNALLGELEQAPLPVPLKAATLDWDIAGAVANELRGAADDSNPETFVLGIQGGSTLTLPAGMAEGLSELQVAFTDRTELAITTGTGTGPAITTGRVPVQVAGNWQEQAVNVDTVLTLTACRSGSSCTIGFDGSAGLAPYTVAGKIDVGILEAAAGSTQYRVVTAGLALGGLGDTLLPPFDVDATLVHDGDTLTFNTPLLLRDAPSDAGITVEGDYDLVARIAEVRAVIPTLQFTEEGQPLSAWFSRWDYPFDLLSGSVAANLDLQWQAASSADMESTLTARVTGELTDVGGFYNEIFFRGVNSVVDADIDTASDFPLDTPPWMLSIDAIDVGVPMENIGAVVRFDRAAQQVLIDSFYMEVLDGTVTGADITYDTNRERNEILVTFTSLRIERMLDLVEYKGVEAIGAISGAVPITITPNGVEVAAGSLSADQPGGSIRYLAGAMAAASGNPGVDMMNRALGNYQFESLTSSIDYTPDGELLLAMKLQGHNPDFQNGQRINLNLNLSDDVPALLESLQAARRIEDFLELQYQ